MTFRVSFAVRGQESIWNVAGIAKDWHDALTIAEYIHTKYEALHAVLIESDDPGPSDRGWDD